MEEKIDSPTWPENFLQDARMRKDPRADKFVAELAATKNERELYTLMQLLLNEYVWVDDEHFDDHILAYIMDVTEMPEWADPVLLKQGEEFFALHGFEISMMLLLKALPSTYCCYLGAEVVHASGRLTEHSGNLRPFTRRLMQTSKFVLNVMSDGGLNKNAAGIQSAIKVRTLHAFVRYFLACKSWDAAKFGEPINQEDKAGTLLSFSVFVVEGMERIGIHVSDDEKKAYYHTWRVVGALMGVEDAFLCKTYDEAAVLGHAILDHQKGPSEVGKELTQACLNFIEGLTPKPLKFLPENMMYFLMGPELSEMVGIKKTNNPFLQFAFFGFRGFLIFTEWLRHNFKFVERWAIKLNPKLLDIIIQKFLHDTENVFTPDILKNEVETIKNKRPA